MISIDVKQTNKKIGIDVITATEVTQDGQITSIMFKC